MRNPLYSGRVVHDGWGVDTEAAFEPIVPEETFLRAQEALSGRRRRAGKITRKQDHPDFPLRRFVRCGACGTPLTAAWSSGNGGRYGYYFCRQKDCRAVKLRAELLEEEFVEMLRRLQPTRDYLVMLKEEVLAALDNQRESAYEARKIAERRVNAAEKRRQRLIEAYFYERAIDQETYERERERIGEDLTLAKLEHQDAAIEDMDVDGIFFFAFHVLTDAARIWVEMSPDAKRRFEQHLYPDGLPYEPGRGFRTATSSFLFRPLELPRGEERRVVEAAGIEPASGRRDPGASTCVASAFGSRRRVVGGKPPRRDGQPHSGSRAGP